MEGSGANQREMFKARAIKQYVCKMIKAKWHREKNKANWQIEEDLVNIKSSKVSHVPTVAILFF
jgi:hypothetical protein